MTTAEPPPFLGFMKSKHRKQHLKSLLVARVASCCPSFSHFSQMINFFVQIGVCAGFGLLGGQRVYFHRP